MKQKCLEGLLLLPVCVIAFIVMFAHATGVKNIAVGVAAMALIVWGIARWRSHGKASGAVPMPDTAVWGAMALWAGWALISLSWSVFPAQSAAAWIDEIGVPFIGFFAFYALATMRRAGPVPAAGKSADAFARQGPAVSAESVQAGAIGGASSAQQRGADRGRYAVVVEMVCWLATLLLAFISVRFMGQLQPEAPKPGLLHFYERVGHSSTFAVIVLPVFVVMFARAGLGRFPVLLRFCAATGLIGALLIGILSLNRFFLVSAVVTLWFAIWPLLRRRWWLSLTMTVLVAVLAMGAMIYTNDIRHQASAGPAKAGTHMKLLEKVADVDLWRGAFTGIAEDDTRPMIWDFYSHAGWAHRWVGIGFGKRLPHFAYAEKMPEALSAREHNAKTHAHNLFLNTWLEVGFVGLFLQCLMFAALLRAFLQSYPADGWLRSAGVALLLGVLSKNLTDDFMWQSTMLAFWSWLGWWLGQARLSMMVRAQVQSGRSVAMRRLRRVGN